VLPDPVYNSIRSPDIKSFAALIKYVHTMLWKAFKIIYREIRL